MDTTPTVASQPSHSRRGRRLHGFVWFLQVLLALAFLAHGIMFASPPPEMVPQLNATLPRWLQLFIGIAEVVAAVGLTLPGVTGILPALVAWAAGGLMIVMALATAFHVARNEWTSAAVTALLLSVATYIAYVRGRVRPITHR